MAYDRRRDRKGNAAFTAITIITLLGFATLTVDIGHARKAKAELQNAVDAAAHAAIAEINYTDAGITAARDAAISIAGLNLADSDAVSISSDDVVFGEYDFTDGTFAATNDAELVNAVIVAAEKSDVDAIFALASFGVDTLAAGATTMAVVPPGTPASAVSCYLPLAVPACKVSGEGIFDFQANSNNTDTSAWAALESSNPDMGFVKSQVAGIDCEGGEVGETVNVMNGVGSAASVMADRINIGDDYYEDGATGPWSSGGEPLAPPDEWPTGQWSETPAESDILAGSEIDPDPFGQYGISGPIMLVKGPDVNANGIDDFCDTTVPTPNWTQDFELAGFAFGIVYDIDTGGNPKIVRFRINTEFNFDDYATDGGGGHDYGLVFHEPPRVLPPP